MDTEFTLRLARGEDAQDVFDLSNDDTVRRNSIHQEKIQWDDHLRWFTRMIDSKDSVFYVVEVSKVFVGYIRLEKERGEASLWTVTIHLCEKWRGKGLGMRVLRTVCANHQNERLRALVRRDNASSFRAFLRCGFCIQRECKIGGGDYYELLYPTRMVIAVSNSLYDQTNLFKRDNVAILRRKEELTYEALRAIRPDYVFFPHWSHIIPSDIYENFRCVVFHMTDVPFGRGGSPLQNLIERKIYQTKISALKCVKELDAGDVYLQRDFDISYGSAQEIYARAATIISEMIDEIISKNPVPTPQKGTVTTFKRRKPAQSNIGALQDIGTVVDFIRMLDAEGYPRAFVKNTNIKYEFFNVHKEGDRLFAQVEIKEET